MNQRESSRSSAETVESVCTTIDYVFLPAHFDTAFRQRHLVICPRACSYVVVFCNKFFTWTNKQHGNRDQEQRDEDIYKQQTKSISILFMACYKLHLMISIILCF